VAVFGLPGGAEWAIIALLILMLFVPGVLVFWFGYLTGRNAATREAAQRPAVESKAPQEDKDV